MNFRKHAYLVVGLAVGAVGSQLAGATTLAGSASKDVRHHPNLQAPTPLPNFQRVHPYLYRGGAPTSIGLERLDRLGVRTIVDLRTAGPSANQERAWAEQLGMKYVSMPTENGVPTPLQVAKFLQIVEIARAEQGEKPVVYVHGRRGVDSTGCLVAIWRMTHDGYSYDRASTEMRQFGNAQDIAVAEVLHDYSQSPARMAMSRQSGGLGSKTE